LYRVPYARPVKIARESLLGAERRSVAANAAGGLRVGVGYPNTYHVAMSSLAFQWVAELAATCDDVGVERLFELGGVTARSIDVELNHSSHLGDVLQMVLHATPIPL